MLTSRNRERKKINKKPNTGAPLGLLNFFIPESKGAEYQRLCNELKSHLGYIYGNIHDVQIKRLDGYHLLREAFKKNEGLDMMDALRQKIRELYKQHRANISNCERCEEITTCCCSGCLVLCTQGLLRSTVNPATLPPPTIMELSDYEDPSHSKSPYRALVKAVTEYTAWYNQLPQYFRDVNFEKVCNSFKEAYLVDCDEAVVQFS